ncbi:hypothetical protein [Marivirga sp.]|uniref:hypothetical protein n=1 Tax=Marivirga sp. TaxID=2018662 RepID=UPI003DA761A7
MRNLILIVFIATVFHSCSNKNSSQSFELRTDFIKSKGKFSDSLYVYDIRSLLIDQGKLYVAEYENGIKLLDTDLNFISCIGELGEGPEEIFITPQIQIYRDTIYAISSNKRAFMKFSKRGKFISELKYDREIYDTSFKYRFIVSNNGVFLNNKNLDFTLYNLSHQGKLKGGVPFSEPYNDINKAYVTSGAHLLKFEDKILHLSDNKAEIRVFKQNEEVDRINLADFKPFKERLKFIKANGKLGSTSYYNMIQDAYIDSTHEILYILSIAGENSPRSNAVSLLDLNNDFQFLGSFNLNGDWYKTIAVENSKFFAFNTVDSKIEKYEIEIEKY